MTAKITAIVALCCTGLFAAVLIAWDILAATNKITGDTISEVALASARRNLIIPVAVSALLGLLLGHLWWPADNSHIPAAMLGALIGGMVIGRLCWPQ